LRVEVEAFATLARFLPPPASGGRAGLDVPDDSTVADLTRRLGIPPETALLALVNGRDARPEDRLSGDDVVTLFPPLVGGAG
jgi:sulfur carrier protein ThiS